ncbi:transposase domain-containing protein [Sulfidibacter corallicola]
MVISLKARGTFSSEGLGHYSQGRRGGGCCARSGRDWTNGWEPYAYLKQLFERLPAAQTDEDLALLLPTCSRETIANSAVPDATH